MDGLLAGDNRKKELETENQSAYGVWRSELHGEFEVFVARVNDLHLDEPSDQQTFYSLINRFASAFRDLRDRSEASAAPTKALIRLEELIEEMDDTSAPVQVSVAYIGSDPFKKASREKRREEHEQKDIERVREIRDEIADRIHDVIVALDEPSE